MRKRGLTKGQWIFWAVALFGWFAPAGVLATSDNLLVNGDFSANGGGWTGANGGAECANGVPSLGIWGGQPQLTFSYMQNSVSQQVTISSPSTVELSFLANGPSGGTYSANLSDTDQNISTGVLTAGANNVSNLQVTTTSANEVVTVTFSGKDSLFWAGCYGPVIRNASLTATSTAPVITTGLNVRGYNISSNQPTRVDSETPDCSSQYANINDWPGTYMAGCQTNQVMLHYTGKIVIPSETAQFRIYSDDGAWVTIAEQSFGYWGLRGCNYTESPMYSFNSGESIDIDAWFYEWGGGECFRLYWNIGNGWEIVPSSAFTSNGTPPTTTTTTTTTTIPAGSYSGGGCGPYSPIYVTGTTNGSGWGTGPFTDDSNFNAIAVFLGLIEPGESAWLEPYDVNNYQYYSGGTQNGVTTSIWGSSWCGFNVKIYGTPTPTTTTTTTTTIPKTLGQPQNVSVIDNGSEIVISWDAATNDVGISPERYAISWSNGQSGWGIATGNVGDANALNTQVVMSYALFESTGGLGEEYTFTVRADNDTYGIYSQSSEGIQFTVSGPPPTTTTTTTTTTVPEEPEPTLPPDTIPVVPDTTDGGPDGGTGDSADTTSPETTVPQPAPEEETPDTTPDTPVEEPDTEQVVDDILAGDPSPDELADAVENALSATESEEELVSVATELLTSDLDPEQFAAVVAEVFSQDLSDEALTELVTEVFSQDLSDEEIAAVVDQVFTADISDEAFAEVLDAVFEEPLSDEAFTSVIDAILDEPISDEAFDELVDVLGSDTVSDEQVVAAVDTIIENGLSETQSISIATSGEVLESITGDQASEIFDTVPISEITDAEAAALVEAVQDAPTEVKEAFEEEINIFAAGNVDTYVPLGSNIPVSTRRVLIAATGLTLTMIPVPVQVSPTRIGK